MLMKIGRGFVDPLSVIGISPQTNYNTDVDVILVWLDGISHPFIHDKYEGTPEEETIRISQMLNDAIELERKDKIELDRRGSISEFFESGNPEEEGVAMIRMPADELQSQAEAAFKAGWDARDNAISKTVTLGEDGLADLYEAIREMLLSDTLTDSEKKEMFTRSMKTSYGIVVEALDGDIEWEA